MENETRKLWRQTLTMLTMSAVALALMVFFLLPLADRAAAGFSDLQGALTVERADG